LRPNVSTTSSDDVSQDRLVTCSEDQSLAHCGDDTAAATPSLNRSLQPSHLSNDVTVTPIWRHDCVIIAGFCVIERDRRRRTDRRTDHHLS